MPTSASTAHLSADHARRFLVRRQLLDPPRSLPAKPESVLRVVERLGSVQFDPLEVPGARSSDLMLHARIKNFRRKWTDGWLYAPRGKRRLIELYNKSLNILPIRELPLHRAAWEQWRDGLESGVLHEHAELVATIL
ncbi:MAG: DNA glycosylase AlkZ-like family protein, partial [Candidatus Limnocylindria bacterium]